MIEKAESWKRISSKNIADCRVFKVRKDLCERESDALQSTFFVLENPDWVNVIALTKTGEIVLIEQYRYGTEEMTLEIPGGMVDADETAETAARRELLEETGFSSDEFILLGRSHPNPALQNNLVYHYLALNCEKTEDTNFDEHESVVTKLAPLTEIKSLIENGKITHSLVIAAFYYLKLKEYES